MADSLGEFRREYRRDPSPHWAMIAVLAILGLLLSAGIVWLVIKPDGNIIGRAATAILFAVLLPVTAFGIRHFWLKLRERFRLHEHGLEFFDGVRPHRIAWNHVAEIREAISMVKVYGLTASGPKPEVELMTTDGLKCSLSGDVLELESLSPVVTEAVNACLREQADRQLQRGGRMPFGVLHVSRHGIEIESPAPQPWWQTLKERFSQNVNPPVTRPCRLSWNDVDGIRFIQAVRGDALANRTTYQQIEIRAAGTKDPVFVYPVPQFPNFFLLMETLEALEHPIQSMPDAKTGSSIVH
jgi:hypothetical protein